MPDNLITGGYPDQRLTLAWEGSTHLMQAADPEQWGETISQAVLSGDPLIFYFDSIDAAQKITRHVERFAATINTHAGTAVHPLVLPGGRSGVQLRAAFTTGSGAPAPTKPGRSRLTLLPGGDGTEAAGR